MGACCLNKPVAVFCSTDTNEDVLGASQSDTMADEIDELEDSSELLGSLGLFLCGLRGLPVMLAKLCHVWRLAVKLDTWQV